MGVIMQAFYWDCPKVDNKEFAWWNYIQEKIPALAQAGFSSLWLPPAHKPANINGSSMGYDPYDYYELGEYNQCNRPYRKVDEYAIARRLEKSLPSARWIKKVERYYQLKKKGDNRTPEETSKMNQLQQEIEVKFPNLEL